MEDEAAERRSPVHLEVAVAVPREGGDAVALLQTEGAEDAGEAGRPLGEVRVGVAEEGPAGNTRGDRLLRPEPAAPLEEVRQRERVVHHEVVELRTHRHWPPGSLDVAQRSTIRPRPGGIVTPAEDREFRTDGSGRCPGSTPGTPPRGRSGSGSWYREAAMRSRWNDAEARGLEGLDLLVYASRLVGAETSLVVWGGGNTSIKTVERDHRGREIGVLRVKGSGSDLKSVQRKDFPGVRMDDIRALLERQDMGDQEMVGYLAHALQDPGGVRPSIETLLHGFVDAHAVVHTHADAIVSLTNTDRPREILDSIYGKDVIALEYRRPGFKISREVADAIGDHAEARALVLERHGTITWGATVREAYEATIELITRAEEAIAERRKGRRVFGGARVPGLEPAARRQAALAVAPPLRGVLSRSRRVLVGFDDSPDVIEFVSSVDAARVSQVGPATPDHTIYAKRLPCFVDLTGGEGTEARLGAIERSIEDFVAGYTRYFEDHRFEGAQLHDPLPRVVLVPGLGMFTAGKDRRTAGIVNDIYHHTIGVLGNAGAFGQYVSLSAKDAFDVEYWPLELYKLTLAPPEKELARRIALVTGGGSGIGRAVARKLAAEGAHVVVGDLDGVTARPTADEIVAAARARPAPRLAIDVTPAAAVPAG